MERNNVPLHMLIGFSLGLNGANLAHILFSDSSDQVREAQQYNAQISEQLSDVDVTPKNLIVEVDGETFAYDNNGINGRPEKCEGSYEVNEDEDRARIVGDLACTQTTELNLDD